MKKGDRTVSRDDQADLFGQATPQRRNAHTPPRQASAPVDKRPAPAGGLLNVRQAAVRLGLSKSTLDKLRCKGRGPRFIKSTERAVRYDPADLDAWIEARRRQSTSSA